jgi:hypothetical protein
MTSSSPVGLTCNAPYRNLDGRSPLAFAELYSSDDLGHCRKPSAACRFEAALASYGPAYNRAMVEQPSFPYRDICRPRTDEDDGHWDREEPRAFTEPARTVSGPIHDLHEAVRRGLLSVTSASGSHATPWTSLIRLV